MPIPSPATSFSTPRSRRRSAITSGRVACVAVLAAAMLLPGCGGRPKGTTIKSKPTGIARKVDPILRGTLGSIATTTAGLPTLISGYGLVVGINGTGGGVLADDIVTTLERQMQLQGIGRGASYTTGPMVDPATGRPKTAREILADPNVAVVLVQAVVARGSPKNFEFDVIVRALNATSLEGGLLWSTDLRLGPPASFGRVQTRKAAEAYGPIYTNPFLEPDSEAAANQPVGRVLAGGLMTDPLAVQLALDVPSHVRATQIVSAVNSRFRSARYDPGPIARGRSDSLVDILIPYVWRSNPGEFLGMLEHLQLDYQFPAAHAQRIVALIRKDPALASTGTELLVALGDPALPMVRELYDESSPELRLAGLAAGARLSDERVEAGLIEFAQFSSNIEQLDAINMLGRIDGGLRSRQLLKNLASSGPVTVRIAAYAAIAERAERATIRSQPGNPNARAHAEMRLIHRGIGGFDRRMIGGDSFDRASSKPRFILDRVPWGEPLVFVTQQGRPRVVLMGERLEIPRPTFISLWGGRLVMVADSSAEPLRLAYRRGESVVPITVEDTPTSLDAMLAMLVRVHTRGDPRPGLSLSYGEVVSVLAGLSDQADAPWAFTTERDTLTAALAQARTGPASRVRPETTADVPNPESPGRPDQALPGIRGPAEPRKPVIVPIDPITGARPRR